MRRPCRKTSPTITRWLLTLPVLWAKEIPFLFRSPIPRTTHEPLRPARRHPLHPYRRSRLVGPFPAGSPGLRPPQEKCTANAAWMRRNWPSRACARPSACVARYSRWTFQFFTRRPLGLVGGYPQTSLFHVNSPATQLPNLWQVGDSIFPGQSTAGVTLGRCAPPRIFYIGRLINLVHPIANVIQI